MSKGFSILNPPPKKNNKNVWYVIYSEQRSLKAKCIIATLVHSDKASTTNPACVMFLWAKIYPLVFLVLKPNILKMKLNINKKATLFF